MFVGIMNVLKVTFYFDSFNISLLMKIKIYEKHRTMKRILE